MNDSEKDTCRHCGAAIPASSTGKLCPACLLSGAINTPEDEIMTVSPAANKAMSLYGVSEFPYEFGAYRLLGLLGRGGMGTVYEAEQLNTGRRVALKMLGQQLDSPEMRRRFLREGRLAAGVNHPNSLYVFGSEEIEDLPVITMEIAGSGTLKDKLKQQGPLPVPEAVDAILDVVSGLESACAHGVLHRDIKPSNCFVCPDGSVKVGDFGLSVSTLARTDTFVTAHGKIMGTPAYASPEQLRGDTLDLRADIYSVGATLFSLLTDRAPFEGDNAVQVVANAVNQKPKALSEFRDDVAPGLERIVMRCLAKEPEGRFPDYQSLRNALLPFSSQRPEPASLKLRSSAGWIDFLSAFLIPYVVLMLVAGAEKFHMRPFAERTLYSARYYCTFLLLGFLYFAIAEGIWGGGLGKRLKGLRVLRPNGRVPGMVRALIRIAILMLFVEGFRFSLMMLTLSPDDFKTMTGLQAFYFIGASILCPWIGVLLTLGARHENGFATVWDRVTGTRVVVKPKGTERPKVETATPVELRQEGDDSLGPYEVVKELVPQKWIIASDPVLRRPVWLLRQDNGVLSLDRRNLARPGRLRWLQQVETDETTWNAYEATQGTPLSSLIAGGKTIPWGTLRHWLHDLAAELWATAEDQTLPNELSLDHVWITTQGQAIILDHPWPEVTSPAEALPVGDLAGQQRFLSTVAAFVESTSLPLHARGVLQNLNAGTFEKLSFLTGILRGLLDKPAAVSKGIRAGSIFMLPLYIWTTSFVGYYTGEADKSWTGSPVELVLFVALVVLGSIALLQLLEFPLSSTASHAIFRLAIVNARGERASRAKLYVRWAIVWLPLLIPLLCVALFLDGSTTIRFLARLMILLLWIGAAVYAVIFPNRGLHDRLAGTWVVRR